MKKLLKKLDAYIDRMWRNFYATILYYFDNRKDEFDIDWLNMANNMKFDDTCDIIFGDIIRIAKNKKAKSTEITDFFKRIPAK